MCEEKINLNEKKVKKMSIESEGEDGMTPIHYVCRLLSIKKETLVICFPSGMLGKISPNEKVKMQRLQPPT